MLCIFAKHTLYTRITADTSEAYPALELSSSLKNVVIDIPGFALVSELSNLWLCRLAALEPVGISDSAACYEHKAVSM